MTGDVSNNTAATIFQLQSATIRYDFWFDRDLREDDFETIEYSMVGMSTSCRKMARSAKEMTRHFIYAIMFTLVSLQRE